MWRVTKQVSHGLPVGGQRKCTISQSWRKNKMRWQLGHSCASPSRTDQTLRNSKDSSISFFFSSARLMCTGTVWETPLSLTLILILLFLATLHWSTVRENASINNVDPSEHPLLLFLGINSVAYSKCSANSWTWEIPGLPELERKTMRWPHKDV